MPTFSISGPGNVIEGNFAVFTVNMTGSISSPFTIWFSTTPGTASAGRWRLSEHVCEYADDVQSRWVDLTGDCNSYLGRTWQPTGA